MDLLTNILIWTGILIAVAVVVLAIHEFVWKPRQRDVRSDAPEPTPPAATPPAAVATPELLRTEEEGEASKPVAAEEPATIESSAVARSATAPVPPADPVEQFKRLSRSQRLGLARLTTMPASFDRAAGLAVAACKETDFDAILATGLVGVDPESGRFALIESGRSLGSEHLTPEDAELVRQFHTEHFSRLVEQVHATDLEDREAAVLGFELVKEEWPHLRSVLERLSKKDGKEQQFLEFSEAVNATGIFQTQTEDGIHWYQEMTEKSRIIGDRERELDAVTSLGSIYAQLNRPGEALDCYSRGAELCRELNETHQEGSCIGNMGLAYQNLGELEKAEECFEKVLIVMRDEGDVGREGFALASLGHIAEKRGDYTRAIEFHEEHLKLNLENSNQAGEMLALAHLGEAHLASGQPAEAVSRFERQLKLATSTGNMPSETSALGNLGRSCRAMGNPDKAADYFSRQIESAHLLKDAPTGLFAMGQLGQCHQDANRTWKAVECFDDQLKLARQIGDQLAEARALRSAARAVKSLGRLPDAITRVIAALAILDAIKSPEAEEARADLEQWRKLQG